MNATKETLDLELKVGDIETHGEQWGGQTVRHIDLPAGTDFTPLFKGLPGDMCQCPHWGYIVEGSITLRYADGHEETSNAGDMYFWPGGHTGWTDSGVVFIEFSPSNELTPVLEHLAPQLAPSA